MVVALTEGQWKALKQATGTAKVFEALETALGVDLRQRRSATTTGRRSPPSSAPGSPSRDLDQASAELDRARVLWGPYRGMADVAAAHRRGAHPVLADIELGELAASPASPMRKSESTRRSPPARRCAGTAPTVSRGRPRSSAATPTQVLTEVLGLTAPELAGLHDRGVI